MSKIFVSYRRDDSRKTTERIHDRLVQEFGKENVFLDVDDHIAPGEHWADVLQTALSESQVLIVIIGSEWERILSERAAHAEDYVRFEIEQGLNRGATMTVIPVLVNGASIPSKLPPSLQALSMLQIDRVRPNPDFHKDMDALIEIIQDKYPRQINLPRLDWKLLAGLVAILIIVALITILPALLDNEPTQVAATAAATDTRIPPTATSIPPTATPLSGELLFSREMPNGNHDIFLLKLTTGAEVNLTNHEAADVGWSWSPDGGQIAFHSDRGGNFDIYVMNADGSDLRQLATHEAGDFSPAWSPDGSQIVFHSLRDGNREIYVVAADGTDPRRLTNNAADDFRPGWSPDAEQIVFYSLRDGNREIYVMAADGTNVRRLTNNADWDSSPAWSPDGSHIAFHSLRGENWDIYVMGADGTNVRRRTNHEADDFWPVWSPDGSHIAFVSERDGNFEIYVMNADGTNVWRITTTAEDESFPRWLPVP